MFAELMEFRPPHVDPDHQVEGGLDIHIPPSSHGLPGLLVHLVLELEVALDDLWQDVSNEGEERIVGPGTFSDPDTALRTVRTLTAPTPGEAGTLVQGAEQPHILVS